MGVKAVLRHLYKKKRQGLDEVTYHALQQDMLRNFCTLSFQRIRYLHCFFPIQKFREPDTLLLMQWLRQDHPAVHVVTSKLVPGTTDLEHYYNFSSDRLMENSWGIPEPTDGIRINADALDMVLVPLLIFDKQGHRVGYGKGFYDRFLQMCRPDCQKVGLSLFEPVEFIRDVQATDIALDACISPSKVWLFKGNV